MAFIHFSNKRYYLYEQVGKSQKLLKSLGPITKREAQEQLTIWKQENSKLELWKNKINPIPKGPFDIVYADPPWRYEFSKTDNRAIENHYPTMELSDICKLKIPSADNCVLMLWATAPKLLEAFEVIKAWKFQYKTNMVWVKDKIGMGFYVRGRHEHLLIATKGKPKVPATVDRQDSIIFGSRDEHSAKPLSVYDIIESSYPKSNYIELFARSRHSEKWEVWGNQV